jgi:hypothetical protein
MVRRRGGSRCRIVSIAFARSASFLRGERTTVDDVARDVGPVSPNVCKEFFARHDVTGALHEVVEQIVLAPCQRGDQNLA